MGPDLEVRQEVRREARMEVRMVEEEVLSRTEAEHPVESRQTGTVLQDVTAASDNLPSYTEAGTEAEDKKQQLSDAKAWIQNSLITGRLWCPGLPSNSGGLSLDRMIKP